MSQTGEELQPSELGTLDYWESSYATELKNFSDHGDIGEIWFGEDSEMRVLKWLLKNSDIKHDDPIIDLGCGNGMMLIELARNNYSNLTGVDYSSKAIDLAKAIVDAQGFKCIKLQTGDILSDETLASTYFVILDKGTYDAISLCPDNAAEKRKKYASNVFKMLKPNGFFIITSCNWTAVELINHFNEDFELCCEIPTPKFQFGGKTGSLVSSIVFKRKNNG